jgi:hypothetical protein
MIRSALIRERVLAEAIRMCKYMQVSFPHQFPDEPDVYDALQVRGERDLAEIITRAVMEAFGAAPSKCKDPRFDKTHRLANKLTKKLRGGNGVEA